jgi:hypothetical protein
MSSTTRTVLAGSSIEHWRRELLLAPPVAFTLVFGAYALGLFAVTGGVVFLPGEATLVGLALAAGLAVAGRGLLLAWLTVYTALLGYAADHYLLGLSGRPLGERLVAFLGPDGLVFYAVATLVLGTLAWSTGRLVLWGVTSTRGVDTAPESR